MRQQPHTEKANLQAEFDAVSDVHSDSQSSQRFKDPNQQWLAEESPPSVVAATSTIPGPNLAATMIPNEPDHDQLAQQIADLNRQHAEAQEKLQTLMQQQQQFQVSSYYLIH